MFANVIYPVCQLLGVTEADVPSSFEPFLLLQQQGQRFFTIKLENGGFGEKFKADCPWKEYIKAVFYTINAAQFGAASQLATSRTLIPSSGAVIALSLILLFFSFSI